MKKLRLLGVTKFGEQSSTQARSLTRTDLILHSRVIPVSITEAGQKPVFVLPVSFRMHRGRIRCAAALLSIYSIIIDALLCGCIRTVR